MNEFINRFQLRMTTRGHRGYVRILSKRMFCKISARLSMIESTVEFMSNFPTDEFSSGESCPRCGAERLRVWSELTDEEQEFVRRLPGAFNFPLRERAAQHLWCTRCFYETTERLPRNI